MKCFLMTYSVFCLVALTAHAQPVPDAGTDGLCGGYEETVEGVWLDGENEVLRFRFASNQDAEGCYATLNTYSAWGATDPAEYKLNPVMWKQAVRNAQSIIVDLDTGEARYNFGGATAVGRLLRDH